MEARDGSRARQATTQSTTAALWATPGNDTPTSTNRNVLMQWLVYKITLHLGTLIDFKSIYRRF